jgi:hypothetical protein
MVNAKSLPVKETGNVFLSSRVRERGPEKDHFSIVFESQGKYNSFERKIWRIQFRPTGGEKLLMIRAFNKHYRKAIDLIENASASEKMEMAEKIMEWFRELPEEYVISLALFFNEVIDDLGDDSLEKINLKVKQKKGEEEEDEEEEEDYDEEEEDEDDYDEDKEDY